MSTSTIVKVDLPISVRTPTQYKTDINSIRTNLITYCHGHINSGYFDWLLSFNPGEERIFYYGNEGGRISGFAIVTVNEHEYYIDLICSAPNTRMDTRDDHESITGTTLLNTIQEDAIASGKSYIGLKALDSVIPYYYKNGYRFIQNCDEGAREEDISFKDLVTQLGDE